MATEYPPLGKSFVISYANNDRDYPIIGIRKDPRVENYKIPEDLSSHPDSKRYPNHVFTGAQATNSDERVQWVYEILPAPWVPFTRYDDDLGPVQGRRRSVKNEGQIASLAPDKRVNYEAREGSAIVYTEIEESWSIATDRDGNSLFPVKTRDIYDASRGAIQETRQLFVPTGEEQAILENNGGTITQTSYEPYNEYLSVKIIQTYSVDGPKLVGKSTDDAGQLLTVTTQRKATLGYIPPSPTATRTIEASGEDAESLIERVIDTPEVFSAPVLSAERPDPVPQKFRVLVPTETQQQTVEGIATTPALEPSDLSKTETQQTKFVKRVSVTSRDATLLPQSLVQKSTSEDRQIATITETLQFGDTSEAPTATKTIESESLGDGSYIVRKTIVPQVFDGKTISKEIPDPIPQKFRVLVPSLTQQQNIEGSAQEPTLITGDISRSEQQVNKFVKRTSVTSRSSITLPQTLTQKNTTNEGLLAEVSETLQNGDTSIVPTATKTIESESLGDGNYIVRVTTLPKVFAGSTYSVEKQDPLPPKFKVAARTTTSQQSIEGTANPAIELTAGQLSKSEQQVTEFVKRVSTTSRDQAQLPISLVQKNTDNDRQPVTVTQTLQNADTVELPSATVTIESEALGDGNYVVTRSEIPSVFGAESYRKTKEDLTPQKFRAAQEDTTVEQTIAGIADNNIVLASGEFSKTEQQINKFVKRVSTTSRAITNAVALLEKVMTQDGRVGTRTITLASGDQSFSPSALMIDASVEALGDGRTVKSETVVPTIFVNKSIVKTRVDLTPEKFRAAQEDTTIEESSIGQVSQTLTLGAGEFRKSEEQVTQFVKRTSTNSRSINTATSLTEYIVTNQGQLATRTLRLSSDAQSIQPDALLVDGSIENLGDGRTIKTEVRVPVVFDQKSVTISVPDVIPQQFRASVPTITTTSVSADSSADPQLVNNAIEAREERISEFTVRKSETTRQTQTFPTLSGQEYDQNLNIPIRYTEKITQSGVELGVTAKTVNPLSDKYDLVRTYDLANIEEKLSSILLTFPTTTNMDLPPVLRSVTCRWSNSTSTSNGYVDGTGYSSGKSASLSLGETAEANASASVSPAFEANLEYISGRNLPTTSYFFFLKYPVSINDILNKVAASNWPVLKPQAATLVASGISRSISVNVGGNQSVSVSDDNVSWSQTRKVGKGNQASTNYATTSIPASLHGVINVADIGSTSISCNCYSTCGWNGGINWPPLIVTSSNSASATGLTAGNLPATSPVDIPRSGKYLINSRIEIYQFGFAKVYAEVIDASIFA